MFRESQPGISRQEVVNHETQPLLLLLKGAPVLKKLPVPTKFLGDKISCESDSVAVITRHSNRLAKPNVQSSFIRNRKVGVEDSFHQQIRVFPEFIPKYIEI
jgi:hypothetical protein